MASVKVFPMITQEPIPIVFQVRKNSARCYQKCLRDFYQGASITELAVRKFSGRPNIWLAAYDEAEFRPIADRYNIGFIKRSLESENGETFSTVASYAQDIQASSLALFNVCCPFLRAETIYSAIAAYCNHSCKTLMPVVETKEIVLDTQKLPVNRDANVFNSKLREPLYFMTSAFILYSKEQAFKLGNYFNEFKPEDPFFFPIPYLETLDIDTEEQFQVLKATYAHYAKTSPELIAECSRV